FLTALEMLFELRNKRREGRHEDEDESDDHDPSVFPLGIPLIAGPGAIASMILLTNQTQTMGFGHVSAYLAMALVVGMVFVLFLLANIIERILGRTGTNVVTRVFGMLLAALAVQFILDGLRGFGIAG
ncbi:MAG: MarC family protein, partial [Planktomarina sp.]